MKNEIEINGEKFKVNSISEVPVQENIKAEFIGQIIDIFENFLDEKGIEIENAEKEDSENAANIYGCDYGEIQTNLENMMDAWGITTSKRNEKSENNEYKM